MKRHFFFTFDGRDQRSEQCSPRERLRPSNKKEIKDWEFLNVGTYTRSDRQRRWPLCGPLRVFPHNQEFFYFFFFFWVWTNHWLTLRVRIWRVQTHKRKIRKNKGICDNTVRVDRYAAHKMSDTSCPTRTDTNSYFFLFCIVLDWSLTTASRHEFSWSRTYKKKKKGTALRG